MSTSLTATGIRDWTYIQFTTLYLGNFTVRSVCFDLGELLLNSMDFRKDSVILVLLYAELPPR